MASFFYIYVGYVVPASTLIPVVAGFIFYDRINKPLRALLIYLCGAFVVNVVATIMALNNQNNLLLLHLYTIFELVTVLFYYLHAFADKRASYWITVIMIAFTLLCILNMFVQTVYRFNTYTRPLEAIIIIVFSGIYLSRQNNVAHRDPTTTSGRWVASGFLVYFCSSLFQFIFSNVVSATVPKNIKLLIWELHATFVLIMYLFFLRAIMNEQRQR
ncbi:hypothetical protein [Hufsiella ginkgonis]|uniref:Uncharacterized protein n=1 Tax=Hufsiella ginkgonis TaxID=2695274 RepID=A0A7K1XX91_9SPHI|nr:hypothetical protein [Hufsiella ginkgonis]MXV15438.1 hypothetical protein [Hufsiella ginkgonis]